MSDANRALDQFLYSVSAILGIQTSPSTEVLGAIARLKADHDLAAERISELRSQNYQLEEALTSYRAVIRDMSK